MGRVSLLIGGDLLLWDAALGKNHIMKADKAERVEE